MKYLPNLKRFIFTLLLFSLFISCNYNPLGGSNSHIDIGNTPSPFSIISTLADSGQISILWSSSTKADSYTVWYGTSDSNFTNSLSGCVANLICVIPNLTNGNLYYIKVIATNRYGSLDSTNIVSANVRPFNSLIVIPGNTEAYLSWNTVDIVDSYSISYGVYPGLYTSTISGITGTFAVIPGLINGTTYQFKVTASNVLGSEISNQALATPLAPPTAPTSVTTTALSTSQVKINWGASSGFGTITYQVSRSLTSGGPYEIVISGLSSSTLTYTDTSASPGNQYYYVVTAGNEAGNSPNSTESSVVTPTVAPDSLASTVLQTTSSVFQWAQSPGNAPISYTLKRATVPSGPYANVVTCTTVGILNCTDSGISPGKQYYYVISATNSAGATGNSTELSVITPTSAPTGLIFSSVTSSSLNLSWTSSPGTSSLITYTVSKSTSSGSGYSVVSGCSGLSSSSCNDSSLSPGTQYYYIVTATTAGGTSPNSSEGSIASLTVPPSSLTATASSTTSVVLSWQNSPGDVPITYLVKRSLISGSGYVAIGSGTCSASVSVTTCTDNSALPGKQYFYVVTATTSGGTTANSLEANAITPTNAPTGVLASATSATSINISWTASAGTSALITYNILRSTTSGGGYSSISQGTCSSGIVGSTSCTDLSASPGTTYYYVITATTAGGVSANSTETFATTMTNAPLNLSAVATSSTSINLSWSVSPGSATISYNIKRSITSGSGYAVISSGTCSASITSPNASCTDSTALPGTTYYYVVTATTAGGTSAFSLEAQATTLANAPTGVSATPSSTTSITLNWTASSGTAQISYLIYRSEVSGSGYSLVSNGTCSTYVISPTVTCVDSSAVPGTKYYYVISATTVGGVSSFSSEINTTTLTTAPTTITATPLSTNTINLSWAASPGSASISYSIKRTTTSGSGYGSVSTGSCSIAVLSPNVTCIDTSASAGTTYYYVITATTAGGASANSVEASTTTLTTAPTGFVASALDAYNVNLSWNVSPGSAPITYNVMRSSTSGSGYAVISSGSCSSSISSPTITCQDTSATPGTTFYYVVQATTAGGSSTFSLEASATTFTLAPITLTAVATSTSAITVTWAASPGSAAITYNVQRATASGGPYSTVTTGSCNSSLTAPTVSCVDSSASAGTTYYYVVAASTSGGISSNSTEVSATTPTSAPTGLSASSVGGGNVSLNWTASSGTAAITYTVSKSTSTGGPYSVVQTGISLTNFTDYSVTNGTTYYYVVQAVTSGGISTNSSQISVTPISSFVITTNNASPGQIVLVWSSASGASTYTVKQSTTLGGSTSGTNVVGCTSVIVTTCTITGLTNGTTYYYTVVANNTGVGSTASTSMNEVLNTPFNAPFITVSSGTGQVTLSWNAIALATNYSIYISTVSGSAISGGIVATGCNTVLVTNCIATGLINGTKYYIALFANLSSGGTFSSSEVFATPIGAFDITSLSLLSSTSAQIDWSNALGATEYNVKFGTTSGSYTSSQGPFLSSPVTVSSGLTAGTTFYFRMIAANGQGSINSTSEYPITTLTSAPTNISATATSSSAVTLSWNASPGTAAITYNVLRSTTSGSGYAAIASGTCGASVSAPLLTCVDASVSPGVQYYYVVTASTLGGTSSNSTEATVVTPTTAPTNLSGTSTSSTSATISWAASPGTVSITYNLSRATTSGGPYSAVAGCTGIGSISCSDTGISSGNNYFYVVSATNSAGTTVYSSELALTAIPAAPTNFTATAASSSTINLSWTASPGSSSITYTVTRSTFSGSGYSTIIAGTCSSGVSSPTVTCTDTSASPATKYYYIVKASSSGGVSGASIEASAVTYATNPTGVTASANNANSINISWSAISSSVPITYNVYRSTISGSGYVSIITGTCSGNLGASSCTDQSAIPGTTYYYVVTATTTAGASGYSNEANATTFTNTPTNLAANAVSSSSINLSWTASPGTATITYNILRTTTSGSGYAAISNGTCSSSVTSPSVTCTDTSGSPGVKYYYIIQAVTSGGTSSSSSETSATTFTTSPTNLTATPASVTKVDLTWTASPGTANVTYNVKRSTVSGSSYVAISLGSCSSSVSTTSCSDQGASTGTTYYYVVTATTAGGVSSNSIEANTTTPTTTPINLSGIATSSNNINLTWSASPGSATITYTILRSTTSGTGYLAVPTGTCSSSVSGVTCSDTSVTSGNVYYYIISATNAGGTTAYSSEAAVTTPTSAPTNTSASAINSTSITVSWTLSPGNSSINYNVYRSTVSGSGYVSITSGTCNATLSATTSTCTDTSASSATTYYYIVKATNLGGVSAASVEGQATTYPNAPTGLSATATSSSSVTLSWTASSGSATITYNVTRTVVSGSGYNTISLGTCSSGVTTTTCTDLSVSPGTKYYYIVTASTAGGVSPNSTEANVSVPTTPPTGLSITNIGTTNISLSWSQSPGSLTSTYTLMRGSISGGPYTNVTSCIGLSALSCTDSTVAVGTSYYYVVTATNSGGTSSNSSEGVLPISDFYKT